MSEGPGTVIGPYRLLEEIGEGGMGLVFVAEQQRPVRRKVALKVIKPGLDTRQVIARFEAERQALALMDHPNVARVLDAGDTGSGRPFFVMELIQGVPITLYCDQCELTTRERLGLFLQVCRGVQHAHQKGIIHRDVKPTNVLVAIEDGRPVAKVIDFGVAKAINRRLTEGTTLTGFAPMLGTPLYMSPEQAEMSPLALDTRTDIYSLGVLLYELLTGTTPFDERQLAEASFDEVRRVVRDVEPPTPSTRISTLGDRARTIAERRRTDPRRLGHEVRGDLDWIAMKALEKDRARRYETASALAADVERHLKDEPVEACAPSRAYRLRKLLRRNRSSIAVAACLIAASLVLAGSIGWTASDRASRRVALEREVAASIEEASSQYRSGRSADAVASVKRAQGLLGSGVVSTALARQVEQWRTDLDTVVRLEAVLSKQVRERDVNFDWQDADAAYRGLFAGYGIAPESLDAGEAAERLRTSAIREDLLAGLDGWVLTRFFTGLPQQGGALLDLARLADADPWRNGLREALLKEEKGALLELARDASFAAQPPASLQLLGRALGKLGELSAALETLRHAQAEHPADFWINLTLGYSLEDSDPPQAIPFYRAALAIRPASFAAHLGLGNALLAKGDFNEAIVVYRRGIALHPGEGRLRVNLGMALGKAGRDSEEEEEVRRALELDPKLWEGQYNLAQNLSKNGRRDEAIPFYRKALELRPSLYRAHEQLGVLFREEGKLDEAIEEWRQTLAIRPDLGSAYQGIIEALYAKGDFEGALAECRKAVAAVPEDPEAHYSLGVGLGMKDQTEDAAAAYRKAIELDPKHANSITNLAVLLHKQGKTDDAIVELRKSAELDPASHTTRFNLGSMLAEQGKFEAAEPEYRKALELDPATLDTRRCLGIVLGRLGKLDEAVAELREAVQLKPEDIDLHVALGDVLKEGGRLPEALLSYRRCHELGSGSPDGTHLFARMIADCEQLIALEGRLPRVLSGEETLGDGKERLAFADLAYSTRRFALAARFYEEALAAEPGLASDPPGVHRYNAACAAALAGAGVGRDASALDPAVRARRRAQALAWLRHELEQVSRREKEPGARAEVLGTLRHWLHDRDLKGLRDEAEVAGLPPEERQAWDQLWRDVRELLREAEKNQEKNEE